MCNGSTHAAAPSAEPLADVWLLDCPLRVQLSLDGGATFTAKTAAAQVVVYDKWQERGSFAVAPDDNEHTTYSPRRDTAAYQWPRIASFSGTPRSRSNEPQQASPLQRRTTLHRQQYVPLLNLDGAADAAHGDSQSNSKQTKEDATRAAQPTREGRDSGAGAEAGGGSNLPLLARRMRDLLHHNPRHARHAPRRLEDAFRLQDPSWSAMVTKDGLRKTMEFLFPEHAGPRFVTALWRRYAGTLSGATARCASLRAPQTCLMFQPCADSCVQSM